MCINEQRPRCIYFTDAILDLSSDSKYVRSRRELSGEIYGGGKEEAKGRIYLAIQEDIVIKANMPPGLTTNVFWANVKPSVVSL